MASTYYDADNAPDPAEWLALSDSERVRVAQSHHVAQRVKGPNLKAHAAVHVIVENQVATGFQPTCRAIERLQQQGLSRHDALHAVGAVVAEFMFASLNSKRPQDAGEVQRKMNAAIEALSASTWRARAK